MPVTFTTAIDRNPTLTSYAQSMGSEVTTLISVSVDVDSHANSMSSSTERVVTLYRSPESYMTSSSSDSSRSQINYADRNIDSHSGPIVTFTTNERTSLELIDYPVDWDESESVWYTPWVEESKILGTEDSFGIQAVTIDDAREPTATVVVEYDGTGNGEPDERSEQFEVGTDKNVHEVTELPTDGSGRYRMQVDEYSGYNSLIALNMGLIH